MADGYISQITLPDNSTYNLKDSNALPLSGGSLSGGLEIKGQIKGDSSGTTGHGLYSGGGYHKDYNNIILHGDASTGTSGIAFVSDKVASDGTITNINAPSDRAFIQYHANGITTTTAEGTAPTLSTTGEAGRLVIGIGNDSGDKILLQAPGNTDILHQKGATGYPIPHTINTNGSVGGTTTPVYVEAGEIKAGTALGGAAYKAVDYYALASHTHTTANFTRPNQLNGINDITLQSLVSSVRANRLAFLPASQIIIENTTDGGATWTDAGITDTAKTGLFSEQRPSISIPKINNEKNINCGVRITFTAMRYDVPEGTAETQKYNYWNANYLLSAERYCQLKEFYFWVNATNDGIQIKVERATGANPNNWIKIFENTNWAATGWSGNDYIRFSQSTFGGGTTQTGNYWNYRITCFTRNNTGGTTLATSSTTSGQAISEIRGYGDTWWNRPNNYMAEDHLYRFDGNQNAIFPAAIRPAVTNTQTLGSSSYKWSNIYATTFTGNLDGNANTAIKFNSNRKIELTGAVTGSANADGSSGWTINTSISVTLTRAQLINTEQMTFTNWLPRYGNNIAIPAKTMALFADGLAIKSPATASDAAWIRFTGTGEANSVLEIATSDDANNTNAEKIVARQYNTSDIIYEAILLGKIGSTYGATSFPVQIEAPKILKGTSIVPDTGNTTGTVGEATTPVYVDEGVIKAGTPLKALAYKDSLTYSDVGAAAASHGNHVPATQTANNITFLRNDNSWYKLTKNEVNTLINLLDTGSSNLTANDYVITQYVGGGTTTTTYHRRPASAVVNATLVKAALRTDTSTTNQWLNKKGEWSTPTAAQVGAAASGHNHSGTYVPNTTGENDVNTIVNTGIYNITSGSATNTPKGYKFGQLLVMAYRKHTGNTTTDWASQIYLHNGGGTASGSATAPGNVLYYRTSNNSSNNTWFDWQKAIHAAASYTKVGDTDKPVYIAEDGTATAISYTIAKSVPSDAKFTDTTYSAASNGGLSLSDTAFSISSGGVTNAMLAGSIANNKLANSKITIAENEISLGGSLTASTLVSSLGLSNALHFIGITSTTLTDGSTTATLTAKSTGSLSKTTDFVDGDVVMDGDQLREYVWSGGAWRLLGITTSTAYSQTATGNSWIASITQGTDGKITATKGSLTTTEDNSNTLYVIGVANASTSVLNHNTSVTITGGAVNATTYNKLTLTAAATGFTIAGGTTTSKTLTVSDNITLKTGSTNYIAYYSAAGTIQGHGATRFSDTWSSTTKNGKNELVLGNSTVSTNNGSAYGQLALYSESSAGTYLKSASGTSWKTATLPAITGILTILNGGTAKGTDTKPVKVANTGEIQECSEYAGGTKITLNNVNKGADTATIYAPTEGGTAGYPLIGAGATSAPVWYAGTTFSGTAAANYATTFSGTTDSSSVSTGAVKISGGLGVAKQVTAARLAANGSNTSYNLYVNGTSLLDGNTTVNGNLVPGANNTKTLGSTDAKWSKLYVGSSESYGNAYQPIYWNNGVPTASYPVQYSTWSIRSDDNTATLTGTGIFTEDTYVISLVVTSGEQYLNGPITWTSAANTLTLSTAATSGNVEGYVLTSIGTATGATCASSSVTT